jgi:ribonuclease HI
MKRRTTNAERRQRMGEVEAMLHQSNISNKNLQRLALLSRHADPEIARLASLALEVGRAAPRSQNRWIEISSQYPKLFEDALGVLGKGYFERLFGREGRSENPLWEVLSALVRKASSPVAQNTQPAGRQVGPPAGQLPASLRHSPAPPPVASAQRAPDRSPASASPAKDKLPHVEIYTDGGCDPNPGPGGYGVVLVHPRKRAEASGAFRLTTNNRMEILAAIKGLEMLNRPCTVTVYSDSQYLVKAMSDGWARRWKNNGWRLRTKEPAKNVDLWERLLALSAVHRVHFRWIKGHAGHRENERCDFLCAAAQRQKGLPPDEPYEAGHCI